MPDLEDAEADITEQEIWGMGRVSMGLKRLVAAVRLIRTRVVAHEARLDAIDERLDRIDPPPL